MDTTWSKKIFGIDSLKAIRDFRFNTRFSELYLQVLPIKRGMKLLDLGCGPGSFTRCVYDWFQGDIQVEGLDSDNGYIDFCTGIAAREHYNIAYTAGDACKTSFPNESFDITTSYTVAQHVENSSFFKEQYRILKHDGYIVIMDVGDYKENIENQLKAIPRTQEEIVMLKALQAYAQYNVIKEVDTRFNKHRSPECMTMKLLSDIGFTNVLHQKIKISGCPDNLQPDEFSRLIIENFYCSYIDFANSIRNNYSEEVINYIANRYIALVNERKAKRIEMYENNIKLWDSIETDVNIFVAKK